MTLHAARTDRLVPDGKPRYVRIYDNGGETCDRYTCVFTGRYPNKRPRGSCLYLGMSAAPFHPQGFGQHGEAPEMIDRPTSGHLGKRVAFAKLPADVQRCIMLTYRDLWALS